MASKLLKSFLSCWLIALVLTMVAGMPVEQAATVDIISLLTPSALTAPPSHVTHLSVLEAREYMRAPNRPGLHLASYQYHMVRPHHSKGFGVVRLSAANSFLPEDRAVEGPVARAFVSQSSFLIDNPHTSRAPPAFSA